MKQTTKPVAAPKVKAPKQITLKISKPTAILLQESDAAVEAARQGYEAAASRYQLIATTVLANHGITKPAKLVRWTESKSPELVIEFTQ